MLGSEADQRVLDANDSGYVEFAARKWADMAPEACAALSRELTRQPDQLDAMRAIACPTLVVVGEEDEVFVPGAHAMAETIAGRARSSSSRRGALAAVREPRRVWLRRACDGLPRATSTRRGQSDRSE